MTLSIDHERVDARYRELCAKARAEGLPVDHCQGEGCDLDAPDHPAPPGVDPLEWARIGRVGVCMCARACEGCSRAVALLMQAGRTA
jgi:hypothetical protein